jgi:SAM-dependent methyltransferase
MPVNSLLRHSADRARCFRSAFVTIAAAILADFSHSQADANNDHSPPADPLELLRVEYPNLAELVTGKSVLDFGSGYGHEAAALAKAYGCKVTGLDTTPHALTAARAKYGALARFVDRLDEGEQFDVIVSQNAFEHFRDPAAVLDAMLAALRPGGVLLITFGPPWYAPYGSHMHFFCRIPWLSVLFPEAAVMRVRARFRQDGARRYEEVESGLNKMTLVKFERLMDRCGMHVESRRYTAIKGLNALTSIPVVREMMTRHVTVVIRAAGRPIQ